jgi:hypothetical protein
MAYKPPLSEGELYKLNHRAVRQWIEDHKSRIKARPGKTVLYSGRIYDLDVLPDLSKEDRELFKGTPVWMSIEKHRKAHKDRDLPFDYETLEQVLKSIRDCPQVVDKDRQVSSSALLTTLTLLDSAIAAPATTGLSRPKAASGMPTTL